MHLSWLLSAQASNNQLGVAQVGWGKNEKEWFAGQQRRLG
jgi:hypothetical protein